MHLGLFWLLTMAHSIAPAAMWESRSFLEAPAVKISWPLPGRLTASNTSRSPA
jgi:hypothetical protein